MSGIIPYKISVSLDNKKALSSLADINTKMTELKDGEVLIDFKYNQNMGDFNKKVKEISKISPELGIQFQYDINKRGLSLAQEQLSKLEEIDLRVNEKGVDKYIDELIAKVKELYDSGVGEKQLINPIQELLNITKTISPDSLAKVEVELGEIYEDFEGLSKLKPISLYNMGNKESLKKDIDYFTNATEKLKKEGAVDLVDSSENKDIAELTERVKILEDRVLSLQHGMLSLKNNGFLSAADSASVLREQLEAILSLVTQIPQKTMSASDAIVHVGNTSYIGKQDRIRSDNLGRLPELLKTGMGHGSDFFFSSPEAADVASETFGSLTNGFKDLKTYIIDIGHLNSELNQLTFNEENAENAAIQALKSINAFTLKEAVGADKFKELGIDTDSKYGYEVFDTIEDLYNQVKTTIPNMNMTLEDFSSLIKQEAQKLQSMGEIDKRGIFKNQEKYGNEILPSDKLLDKLGYTGFTPIKNGENDGSGVGGWIINPERFISNDESSSEYIKVFSEKQEEEAYNFLSNIEDYYDSINERSKALLEKGNNLKNQVREIIELTKQIYKSVAGVYKDDTNTSSDSKTTSSNDNKKSAESIATEAYDEGFKNSIDAHSPAIEGEESADDYYEGVSKKTDELIPEYRQSGEKAGVAYSGSFVESIKNNLLNDIDVIKDVLKNTLDPNETISKYLIGENRVKSAKQLSSEVESEIKSITSDVYKKNPQASNEEYMKALEESFKKWSILESFYGQFNDDFNGARGLYEQWEKTDNPWKTSKDNLSDETYSLYGRLIESQEKLGILQRNNGQDYLDYMNKAKDLADRMAEASKKVDGYEKADLENLDITQEEADNRANALRTEAKALAELVEEIEKFNKNNAEFSNFEESPLYNVSSKFGTLGRIKSISESMEDEAEDYNALTIRRKRKQADVYENALDFKINKSTPKELEDEYEKLSDAIYDGTMTGQQGIEAFNKKVEELGYTFDETAKKWKKVVTNDETPVSNDSVDDINNQTEALQRQESQIEELSNAVEKSQNSSTTSPITSTIQSEAEIANQAIEAEEKKFDELNNKISKDIPNAINKKNEAFEKERDLVAKVVDDEIDYFDVLEKSVNDVTNTIKKQYDTTKNTNTKSKESNSTSSNNVSSNPDRDTLLQQHYRNLRRDAFQSIGQKSDIQTEMSKYYAELEERSSAVYVNASKKTDSLLKKIEQLQNSGKYTDDFVSELNLAQKELNNFSDQLKSGSIPFEEVEGKVTALSKKIEGTLAKKAFGSVKQAAEKTLTNIGLKIDQIIAKNSAMGESFKSKFEDLRKELDKAQSIEAVQRIVAEVNKLESELISAGKTGNSFIDQIKQRLRDINSKYIAQYFSFQDIIRYARQAAQSIIELNDAFIELSKVSNTSIKELESDFQSYADIAKDIGGTISDTINATADWARMGYSVPDSKQLAEVAMLYKNVGNGIDISQANESLISTLQGYQMQADEAEHIVDVFNEVYS